MPVNTTIKIRKGTESEWATSNPILASGEPGYVTNTNRFKIGDGVTSWNSLSYAAVVPSGFLAGSGINISLGSQGISATIGVSGLSTSYLSDFNSAVSGLLPTISNSGDNRVLTSTGSSVGINGESNLTFDGNLLNVTGSGSFSSNLRLNNQTANTIAGFDASKNINSLSTSTYPSLTELSYVKDVTSAIQTQLNNKAALVHTHVVNDITNFASGVADEVNTTLSAGTGIGLDYDSGTDTLTIHVSGLINNSSDNRILTSRDSSGSLIDAESNLTFDGNLLNVTGSGAFSDNLTLSNQTASTIAGFDASKNVTSLSTATYPSLTELSYVKDVTSAIQTQINNKQNTLTNPVTGTGIANHIPYWNSTSGIIADSGQLFWDPTNNRLGIGTNNPQHLIHISGATTAFAGIRFDNSTGQGGTITAANGMLYVNSAFRVTSSKIRLGDGGASVGTIEVTSAGSISQDGNGGGLTFSGTTGRFSNGLQITGNLTVNNSGVPVGSGTSNYVSRWTGSSILGTGLIFDNGSNVGIGNISPSYRLDVSGSGNFTGTITSSGIITGSELTSSQSSGDEGGQINLTKPATNTSINTSVAIDLYQNRLRIFESAGSNRGYYLDITEGAAGAGTALRNKTLAYFTALDNQPPASGFATLDTRNSIAVLDFDDTASESGVFVGILPENAALASGVNVRIHWAATTATSGTCRWGVQFEKMTSDMDIDSFDTTVAESGSVTNATAGIPTVTQISCTGLDSLSAGDLFRILVYRDSTDTVNDTMTGDAELVAVELRSVI